MNLNSDPSTMAFMFLIILNILSIPYNDITYVIADEFMIDCFEYMEYT